jgi:hypothetical protein
MQSDCLSIAKHRARVALKQTPPLRFAIHVLAYLVRPHPCPHLDMGADCDLIDDLDVALLAGAEPVSLRIKRPKDGMSRIP